MYLPVVAKTSGGSSASMRPQMEHIRKDFLQCINCKNEYNQNDRLPRVLPCLHACCDSCLSSIKTPENLKCPTCNEIHSLRNGDTSVFLRDNSREYLINYSKVQAAKTVDLACDECAGSKKKVVSRCKECVQFLCNECTEAHRRTKVTKTHRVMTLDELKDATLDDYRQVQTCTVNGHENQPFTFYCSSSTCERPVCALCVVRDHSESKGHDVRNINDVSQETKERIESFVSDVKHKQVSTNDTVRQIEEMTTKLDTLHTSLTEEIDAAFDKFQKLIDSRRQDLKNSVSVSVNGKKNRLEKQLQDLKTHNDNMEDAVEFANNVFLHSSATEIVNFKQIMTERLKYLTQRMIATVPHSNANMKFQNSNTGHEFEEYVKSMGDLEIAPDVSADVTVRDVVIGQKDVCMLITINKGEFRQTEKDVTEIHVEILGPDGKTVYNTVQDCTATEGCYKVLVIGEKLGRHHAMVYVNGEDFKPEGYSFLVNQRQNTSNQGRKSVTRHDTPSVASAGRITRASQIMVIGNILCSEFELDASVSHPTVEVFEDKKVMQTKQNIPKESSLYRSTESGRLINYRGTLGTKPLNRHGQCYFEVAIQFRVIKLIRQTLLFEIGLTKLEFVDQHYTIDCHPYSWSISARGCHICGKVCLQTWHNCQLLSHNAISPRTPTPANTIVRLHYGFLLDATRRHWIVVDVKNCKIVFRFKNLVISEYSDPLWPVFGIYNSEQALVSMRLLSGKDIENVPVEAIEALAM